MVFQTKRFEKLQYKRSSPPTEMVWEVTGKENGHKIDFLTFKNNAEFKVVVNTLKKYGFIINDKNEVEEEIKHIQQQRNWLDKQEGDSEW
ncbi:MAG: hypothetical protein M0R17_06100 [Candidatus Omnitrophica bacterium]|jgi:hypothetical protein|nr:hypothetical protein [Candidatus Omnitrophota bacterium]